MIDTAPLIEGGKNETGEDYRLGGRSPIVTIFTLLAGPLLSQLINAFYGIVNTLWISKGIGDQGLEVLSSLFLFDMIIFSFGNLLIVSTSSHISYLFGRKTPDDCNQLIADLIRVAIILAIIYPSIVIPTSYPLVKWLAESTVIAHEAFKYELISAGCSIVPFIFYVLCGLLQGEGRTWLFGAMQVLSLVLDMGCFLPLFVVKLHFGVWGAALSQIIAQSVPTIILLILLITGKLTLKIKFSMFFRKFGIETKNALKVGFASFILNLSEAFPQFAMQKFIVLVADHVHMRDPILSSWNIFGRLYTVAICIMVAFDSAFIPSASYAYGHKLYKRVVRLCLHTFWITFVYAGIMSAIVMIWPVELTRLFSKEKDVLYIAKKFMWIAFLSLPIYPVHAIVISFLQAIKRPTRASILSLITTLVPMPIFSAIFYFTHPDSLAWIFGAYIATDISTSLITLIGMSSVFFRMMKLNDGDEISDEEEIQNPSIPTATSVESIADIDK